MVLNFTSGLITPSIISHLSKEVSLEHWLSLGNTNQIESALGLTWYLESDQLEHWLGEYKRLKIRNVYKVLGRQHCLLRYIVPFTTRAKILIQCFWDKQRNSNHPLPPQELLQAWKAWEAEELRSFQEYHHPDLMFQLMLMWSPDRSIFSAMLQQCL